MKKERYSKFRGVYKCGKKWKAQIQVDGVQHYLGVFNTEEEASLQYLKFAADHGRTMSAEGYGSIGNPDAAMQKVNHMKIALGRIIKESSYINLYFSSILSQMDTNSLEERKKSIMTSRYISVQKRAIELQHYLITEIMKATK